MRFLTFKGSPAKILLPSAEAHVSAEVARARLLAGEELTGCVLTGLDLAGERFEKLALQNCVLDAANLANASIETVRLDRVVVAGSTLIGVRATALEVRGCLFESCRFDLAMLSGLNVSEASAFLSTSFRETDLSRSLARGCIMHECDLSGADLSSARMEDSDLRGSTLAGARGLSSLHKVRLTVDQTTDFLEGVCRDLRLNVSDDGEHGPTASWREAPEC